MSPSGGFASLLFDQAAPKNSQHHLADQNAICILHRSYCAWLCCSLSPSQAQSDRCKMQMAFQSARWCWEFLGAAWSNKSDANPPERETQIHQRETTHNIYCLAAQYIVLRTLFAGKVALEKFLCCVICQLLSSLQA